MCLGIDIPDIGFASIRVTAIRDIALSCGQQAPATYGRIVFFQKFRKGD